MSGWSPEIKRARLRLMRSMGICTRCQKGVTRKYALCLKCRRQEAARWRRLAEVKRRKGIA